jgi:alkanesulfonate monooxygenase SsuD/methylene tetrahydromethanopterin reductase-like flavin-dependent oxidoreductase (luciferase family)
MLPNHAPLRVAEAFHTLEALHPGRIDLGIGRAPGTDRATSQALRPFDAEQFPMQLRELSSMIHDHGARMRSSSCWPGRSRRSRTPGAGSCGTHVERVSLALGRLIECAT